MTQHPKRFALTLEDVRGREQWERGLDQPPSLNDLRLILGLLDTYMRRHPDVTVDEETGRAYGSLAHDAMARVSRAVDQGLPPHEDTTDLKTALGKAMTALKPLYDSVFNDNGDMTVNTPVLSHDEAVRGYCAYRRLLRLTDQGVVPQPGGAAKP